MMTDTLLTAGRGVNCHETALRLPSLTWAYVKRVAVARGAPDYDLKFDRWEAGQFAKVLGGLLNQPCAINTPEMAPFVRQIIEFFETAEGGVIITQVTADSHRAQPLRGGLSRTTAPDKDDPISEGESGYLARARPRPKPPAPVAKRKAKKAAAGR